MAALDKQIRKRNARRARESAARDNIEGPDLQPARATRSGQKKAPARIPRRAQFDGIESCY